MRVDLGLQGVDFLENILRHKIYYNIGHRGDKQ